ncbi:MAG: hypothetical protein ACRCYE_01435, partial [Sarcina sp.]
IIFADKITYLLLDSAIYYFFYSQKFKVKIRIRMKIEINKILNSGFKYTALFQSLNEDGEISIDNFLMFYNKSLETSINSYRRLLTHENLREKETYPSIIFSDVAMILEEYFTDEDWIDAISEITSELVCNVKSHTRGDCLLHIDIAKKIKGIHDIKGLEEGKTYNAINIGILNFDNKRLFDEIKNIFNPQNGEIRIEIPEKSKLAYKEVAEAYTFHEKHFDENYTIDDFWLITAFQNHITTRNGNGGTGLTNLIERIIGKAQADYSYVLSGDNILFFDQDYMKVSKEKLIAFNKTGNYKCDIPDKDIINKSSLYISGCVYNLLLIKEE